MRIFRIFTSLPFLALCLLLAIGWFTYTLVQRSKRASEAAVPTERVTPAPQRRGVVKEIGRTALEMALPAPEPVQERKEIPPEVRKELLAQPTRMALFAATAPSTAPVPEPPAVSTKYLPFGTLIPCKLINTIDSNASGTPVIAITLEDMRNIDEQGVSQLVIPAGTLAILESTAPGRERDRIAADGTWVFVWRTRDENNGLEMPVSARALSRDYNSLTGLWGHSDGRAGLRGQVIDDASSRRINAAAQAFITEGLSAAKEYDVSSNSLTGQIIRNPIPTLRNALLGGTSAAVQQYADEIRKSVEQNGAYVQVRAGTEFYLFPRQTVDFRTAHRGATAQHVSTIDPAKK